jgi:hypothetical protein
MEPVKIEWTPEYTRERLVAMGYEGTENQVGVVQTRLATILQNHSYQEEILRKTVRDVGAVSLSRLGGLAERKTVK